MNFDGFQLARPAMSIEASLAHVANCIARDTCPACGRALRTSDRNGSCDLTWHCAGCNFNTAYELEESAGGILETRAIPQRFLIDIFLDRRRKKRIDALRRRILDLDRDACPVQQGSLTYEVREIRKPIYSLDLIQSELGTDAARLVHNAALIRTYRQLWIMSDYQGMPYDPQWMGDM